MFLTVSKIYQISVIIIQIKTPNFLENYNTVFWVMKKNRSRNGLFPL